MAGGCSVRTTGPAPQLHSDATVRTENADWNDADAAVYAGIEPLGATVTQAASPSSTAREYRLRTMSGEDGVLVIEREADGLPDPTRLTMHCTLGRLGDPARERVLMDAVARRLVELRGVDFAPRKS